MTRGGGRRERRHQAREAAVQILYQWEIGKDELETAVESYWVHHGSELPERDRGFANALARGVVANLEAIDQLIVDSAEHWRLERMATVDRLVMRLAVQELLHVPDTPPNVVIDEALELARTFSTEEAVKFVNGNLDAIQRRVALDSPSNEVRPSR